MLVKRTTVHMKIFFENESDADNRPSSVPSKFLTQTGFGVKYFFS